MFLKKDILQSFSGGKSMFSHVDEKNDPGMVDVSKKAITKRTAVAKSIVVLNDEITKHFKNGDIKSKKGAVFQTAIIAATIAVKKTSDLIPFCHPIQIEKCKIKIELIEKNQVVIYCEVSVESKTGVEMEALTGASIAALTIYDMCKSMSHDIVIKETRLVEKKGGKSDYKSERKSQK